jgi:hypothetical protein
MAPPAIHIAQPAVRIPTVAIRRSRAQAEREVKALARAEQAKLRS